MNKSEDYSDIPGTYLFDRKACVKGYALNQFCMSLMKPENRKDFRSSEDTYLSQYALTEKQRRAVRDRNWLAMIQEGGNICYVAKLGATCGLSMEDLAASMSGMTKADYRRMMLSGGRPIEGNRSKDEGLRMSGVNVSPIGRNDQVMQARQGAAIKDERLRMQARQGAAIKDERLRMQARQGAAIKDERLRMQARQGAAIKDDAQETLVGIASS